MKHVMSELVNKHNINDISISTIPMDEVISLIYEGGV